MNFTELRKQAAEYLAQDKYSEAIVLYEQCLEADSANISVYWELGLALLLQGKELEAQSVWISVFAQGSSDQIDSWTKELINRLQAEATKRSQFGKIEQVKIIDRQITELNPSDDKTAEAPEIKQFSEFWMSKDIWKGGYCEGDPLDPVGESSYDEMGYISVLHAVYQVCIRPYIKPDTVVLEIGAGRGAWTKTMLGAKKIWCLDALPAEYNHFWPNVGEEYKPKINYIQVSDFLCKDLPEEYFDFLFSFGTFCHISWEGQCEYYRNLYSKMRSGGVGMVMIADFDKYNAAVRNLNKLRVRRVREDAVVSCMEDALRYLHRYRLGYKGLNANWNEMDKNASVAIPGQWSHAGIEETCQILELIGWKVIDRDIGLNHRDPIIHFQKP